MYAYQSIEDLFKYIGSGKLREITNLGYAVKAHSSWVEYTRQWTLLQQTDVRIDVLNSIFLKGKS